MRIQTAHVRIDAPAQRVFDYIAKVDNLPQWSTEFVTSFEFEGDAIRAVTQAGVMTMTTRPDESTGVVDIVARPEEGPEVVFPTRVVSLPDGSSAFTFTLFGGPQQSDEEFDSGFESLRRELDNVRVTFER